MLTSHTPAPDAHEAETSMDGPDLNPTTAIPDMMRTSAHYSYGDTSVLQIAEVPVPSLRAQSVLVQMVSASINPLDLHTMTGTPWLVRLQGGFRKPKQPVPGVDLAGRVVAVGDEVTDYAVGDEVVAMTRATLAEYVSVPADKLVRKPASLSFNDAVGAGVGALTALQGLRDKAALSPGQHVLINGASGGVGTAAVQLAKWMGAEVTAVCSARNAELVTRLGADHVIDYTSTDFTKSDHRFDVIFDNQGNRRLGLIKTIMADTGVYLLVGGPKTNRVIGPVGHMLHAIVRFIFSSKSARPFIAEQRTEDVQQLVDLLADGTMHTVIDTTYPLDELPLAMDQLAAGHVRGKVIINP